jgi:predicted ATP-grasp superfamily ATP-dependent carboligase
MHSPSPATSQSDLVLAVGISARAMAQAGVRAGYRVRAADFFGDADTLDACERFAPLIGDFSKAMDPAATRTVVERLAGDDRVHAVVLGSGFERQPALIDELARRLPVAGCDATAVRRLKDPEGFAALCARLAIPHPRIRRAPPPDPASWLAKREGAAGGAHVTDAAGVTPSPDIYFQERVGGDNVSALFVADGSRAWIVGFSRQWTAPLPHAPYRYGGAVRLRRFPVRLARQVAEWLTALVADARLKGLCSADFRRDGNRLTLLEINPRPGATLDIFDDGRAPLLRAHIAASRGGTFELPSYDDSAAAAIVYADRPILAFPRIDWPGWAADRQHPGTSLRSGDPVCTTVSRDRTAEGARRQTRRHGRSLADLLHTA